MNIYSENYKQNDECYTPRWVVELLLPFIPDGVRTVWCPFDTQESEFVRVLTAEGYDVIASHISTGQDFLGWSPDREFDAIISNPPYNGKKLFVERALSFDVPTALLLPATWMNDSGPKAYIGHGLGLVIPGKRAEFTQPNGRGAKKINFKSIYYTTGFGGGIHLLP